VQIIAATNVQLPEAVEAGRFRRDLYYRLNGAQVHLLPLRERKDKLQVIQHIMQQEIQGFEGEEINVCAEVMALFEQHPWPGNIRQLINVVRATIYTAPSSYITQRDLPLDFMQELNSCQQPVVDAKRIKSQSGSTNMTLADWEKHGIKTALHDCDGNISVAAKRLGITRTTLYKKIERFGLSNFREQKAFI